MNFIEATTAGVESGDLEPVENPVPFESSIPQDHLPIVLRLEAFPIRDNELGIQWEAPRSANQILLGYILTYRESK